MKLLEENIGKTFSDINCTNVFLGQSPKAIEIKAKKEKKTKKQKDNTQNGKNIFVNEITYKGLIFKIYKQLI